MPGPRGFTLLELLVVISIIALASAVATLALRDPTADRLQREADRLATLFESARAQARAMGVAVVWTAPAQRLAGDDRPAGDFSFLGLPPGLYLPERWLEGAGELSVALPPGGIVLGPEPVIGAQRLVLSLGERSVALVTDGMAPFHLETVDTAPAAGGSR